MQEHQTQRCQATAEIILWLHMEGPMVEGEANGGKMHHRLNAKDIQCLAMLLLQPQLEDGAKAVGEAEELCVLLCLVL